MEYTKVTSRGEDGALVFRTGTGASIATISPNEVIQDVSSSATLNVSQSGLIIQCSTDGMIYTLPAVTTSVNLCYTVMNSARAYGTVGFQIQAVTTNGFVGATISTIVAGSRLTLVKATATPGDMVSIIGGGSTTWCIQRMVGTFTNT